MAPFLKLEDYLAPAPLPAILAVLMTLGLVYLGRRLLTCLYRQGRPPGAAAAAAAFVLTAALVAAAVQWLAFVGLAYVWVLRPLAWSLALLGLLELARWHPRRLSETGRRLHQVFAEQDIWGKAALILLGLTLGGLALAALGPPTDSDSINYHLGVPLEILRHHGAFPRADWLYPRLTGLGESLNMLGLAGGTDIFGACLQLAGLLAVLLAIAALARDNLHLIWLAMFVLGCPVVAFLVLSQKPQMLPLAASTIALIMIAQRFAAIDPVTLLMAFGCVFFAMACKYPFLLSGTIVVGAGLVAAYRAERLGWALGLALMAYLVLVFPVHLQNYLFYGDPISPFLERFRPKGDPEIIGFASFHRLFSDFQGSLLLLPVKLIIPESMETITNTLGLGSLLILGVIGKFREPGPPRVILSCALLTVVTTLVLGQIGGRFFLEPYLWMVAAAAITAWRPTKNWFFRLMVGQMFIMALIAGFCGATLFPGALTPALRHDIMTRSVWGYSETRWLDKVLPPEAVILTDLPFGALMPRPFLGISYVPRTLEDRIQRQRARAWVDPPKVNTLVAYYPLDEEIIKILGSALAEPLAKFQEFQCATRNPWRRERVVQIVVYPLKSHQLGSLKK